MSVPISIKLTFECMPRCVNPHSGSGSVLIISLLSVEKIAVKASDKHFVAFYSDEHTLLFKLDDEQLPACFVTTLSMISDI